MVRRGWPQSPRRARQRGSRQRPVGVVYSCMIVVEVCDRHSAAIDAGSRFHHDAQSRSLGAHTYYRGVAAGCHVGPKARASASRSRASARQCQQLLQVSSCWGVEDAKQPPGDRWRLHPRWVQPCGARPGADNPCPDQDPYQWHGKAQGVQEAAHSPFVMLSVRGEIGIAHKSD